MATAWVWWCTAVNLEQELLGIGCNFDGARASESRAVLKSEITSALLTKSTQ
jgi:hypothetical protein